VFASRFSPLAIELRALVENTMSFAAMFLSFSRCL
jgi:hypothetical protein